MFVRILNFALVMLTMAVCAANYDVSERTRVAKAQIAALDRSMADEQVALNDLQTDYVWLSRPEHVQELAERTLGMTDTATAQAASLSMLPKRSEMQVHEIAASAPNGAPALVKIAVRN
jgi:hypothetical protein